MIPLILIKSLTICRFCEGYVNFEEKKTNDWISPAYKSREKPVVSPEDPVKTY